MNTKTMHQVFVCQYTLPEISIDTLGIIQNIIQNYA